MGGPEGPAGYLRRSQCLSVLCPAGCRPAGSLLKGGDVMVCRLCPRNCGAERTQTSGSGYCRMPQVPVLARAALHHWEEPPVSGKRGSGTIFFSGCSLGCVFCQNEKISHQDFGRAVALDRLREICQCLIRQGAHNLNFVNPTHFAHGIAALLEDWRPPVPVVWNSGGYKIVYGEL